MINGRCACGAVRFEVEGEIEDFSHCHCSICRRLHGAAYASFAGVARERFRYLCGEDKIAVYASSPRNDRVFCSICGSTILCDPQTEPERLYLSMSAVDGAPSLPAGYHQYAGSKAAWHEIADDLPCFDSSVSAG
jgi:hypothetical protein